MNRRVLLACLAPALSLLSTPLTAQGLSYDLIDGTDAKYLEKKKTGSTFHTSLWMDNDRVLRLEYRSLIFLLNTEPLRIGTIAVRLD